jgi:hypothetical protein
MLFQYGQIVMGTNTVTAASGTTVLTNVSKQEQFLSSSGSNGQTYQLPDATTMTVGQWFEFYNNAAGTLTINNNGGTGLYTVNPGSSLVVKLATNLVSNGTWSSLSSGSAASSGSKNYLTAYTASTSSNVPNTGNGNFEAGSVSGWSWCNVGTLTNGLPTGTPNFTSVNSNPLYAFTISTSTTAAVGDTYTNNAQTFTVVTALSAQSGTVFFATGTGDPAASGTLTRATGSGTASVTFSAFTKETMSIVSSGQLAGSYSMSIATSGVTTPDLGFCSNAFFIDTEDQAKVLTWKFYYSPISGASNVNFSGTSSNSFGVAVYDVTNSVWLGNSGNFGMVQNSGVGYVTGTFQTGKTTAQLRFVVYNVTATAGASTLYFDDFSVGPQTAPMGPAMSDLIPYTLTIGAVTTPPTPGTNTSSALWRRTGDSMEIIYTFAETTNGTSGSGMYLFPLPSGYVIDTTKVTANSSNANGNGASIVGSGQAGNTTANTTSSNGPIQAYVYNTTNLALITGTATGEQSNYVGQGGSFALGTAPVYISYTARVPIAGWSSNSVQSSDTDTRVVAMQVTQASPTATITSSLSLIKFTSTPTNDTNAGFSTSTGGYTCSVSGFYRCTSGLNVAAAFSGGGSVDVAIGKNSTTTGTFGSRSTTTASATTALAPVAEGTLYCNAGDVLYPLVACTGSTPSISSAESILNFFHVERLSGPAVITATEKVYLQYTNNGGTSVTANVTDITFSTKVFDSHNAWSGTAFTAPKTGLYLFSGSTAWSTSTGRQVSNYVNTVQKFFLSDNGGASDNYNQGWSSQVYLNAGDVLSFRVSLTSTLSNSATGHWISICSQG